MRDIERLATHIKDEIDDAEEYIREAMDTDNKETADLYCTLAGEELRHMNMLHDRVVGEIEEWRDRTGQEPPPEMQARYDILHKIYAGEANKVRLLIQLYKEG